MSGPTTSFLSPLIQSNFFGPCGRCAPSHSSREATINYWDCDSHEGLCSVCVTEKPRDSVIQVSETWLELGSFLKRPPALCYKQSFKRMYGRRRLFLRPSNSLLLFPPNCPQVRRSSYHDVVKVGDMGRLADISGIQSYVINGSKVLFLKRRPQPRPPKGAVGASMCTVCTRHLQDVSLYCSIQCKLDSHAGVKHVSLKNLNSGTDSGSSATRVGPETPHGLHLRSLMDGSDSDSG